MMPKKFLTCNCVGCFNQWDGPGEPENNGWTFDDEWCCPMHSKMFYHDGSLILSDERLEDYIEWRASVEKFDVELKRLLDRLPETELNSRLKNLFEEIKNQPAGAEEWEQAFSLLFPETRIDTRDPIQMARNMLSEPRTVQRDFLHSEGWEDRILTIWMEDDVAHGESTDDAFVRITGKDLDQYIEKIDGKDHFIYLYRGGWVRVISYEGGEVGIVYKLTERR